MVRWLKNNAPLPRSQRILVTEGNTLVIKRASPIGANIHTYTDSTMTISRQWLLHVPSIQQEQCSVGGGGGG